MQSVENLYTQYAAALYGYILSKGIEEISAAIILRHTFVHAFNHLHLYNDKESRMFTWLIRIVHDEMRIASDKFEFDLKYN